MSARSRKMSFSYAVVLAIAMALAGCARGGRAVDERLLAALEEARAWQHRADLHLADGDAGAAAADVERVLAIAFPRGAAEGEEARLDAWARLARLRLGPTQADEDRALADLAKGRSEATRDSFYAAHLETVAGEIYEARAKRLDASDAAGAREARKHALDAYARSIAVNQRVQAALQAEGR